MFGYFWGGVLVALPLFYRIEPYLDLRISKDLLFLISGIISIIFFGFRDKLKTDLMIPLAWLSLLSFITLYTHKSFTSLYQLMFFNFGIVLLIHFISNLTKKDTFTVLNFILISCLVQSCWVFMEAFGIEPLSFYGGTLGHQLPDGTVESLKEVVVSGALTHNTLSGAALAISLPAFFRKKFWILIPIPIIAILLCKSTTATITLLGVIGVYSIFRYKILLLSLPPLLWSFAKYDVEFLLHHNRFNTWYKSLSFVENIWTGHGLGYFSDKFYSFFRPGIELIRHPHSEYVSIYVSFGLLGLLLFFFLLTRLKINNILYLSMFIGILINCLGNFTFHISYLALLGIISYSVNINDNHGGL